jgi:magnesium-transporting ATPase (P-type)
MDSKCRMEDLKEKLRQTDIIFSEMKGVLTESKLKLSQCFIGENLHVKVDGYSNKVILNVIGDTSSKFELDDMSSFYSEGAADVSEPSIIKAGKSKMLQFLLVSLISHLGLRKTNSSTGEMKYFINLNLSLEFALKSGEKEISYVLTKKTSSNTIEIKNELTKETENWEILFSIAFDSFRKRTSLIIKKSGSSNNIIYLLTIGNSDPMLLITQFKDDNSYKKAQDVIYNFSADGPRISIMSTRIIDPNEFSDWLAEVQQVEKIENDDDKFDRLFELYKKLERDLSFTGIYALDNHIKEDVSDTIEFLKKADKRFWIVSSSLPEPILNVARKSGLICDSQPFKIIDLTKISIDEIESKLEEVLNDLKIGSIDFEKLKTFQTEIPMYLVFNSNASQIIFENEELTEKFMTICLLCKSVFGSRLPPIFKTRIAEKVKQYTKFNTLSIGSFASDVPIMKSSDLSICLEECEEDIVKEAATYVLKKFEDLKIS